MKVLYLPLNIPEIIQTGMYDAWNFAQVDLKIFDFYQKMLLKEPVDSIRKEFINIATEFKPDLIHMQLQYTNVIDATTLSIIKKKLPKTIITNWTGDIRVDVPNEYVEISKVVDYSLISSTGQITLYEAAGCKNVRYWQIGYNPKLYYPQNKKNFLYDISFTAGYYGNLFPDSHIRYDAVKLLQQTFGDKFALFGSGFPSDINAHKAVPQSEVNDIYANSLCVLSISNFNDVSHYFSDRLLMCMASGRPTISYRFPGSQSYFTHNSDFVIASKTQEIVDIVKYFKSNPEEANKIGTNGSRRVLAEHTYSSRVLELLSIVGLR